MGAWCRGRVSTLCKGGDRARRTLVARGHSNYPPPPGPPEGDLPCPYSRPPSRSVFANRTLSLASITAIGFDSDYTLTSYVPETFEKLAHAETVEKLITKFGYPDQPLRSLSFDPNLMVRGLVIDKELGNILKCDRHKYIKLAYHGFSPLSRDERMQTYNSADKPLESFESSSRFAMVDTLFSLAEAHLFMSLVELKDQGKLESISKTYAELYRDSRAAVDLAHRDGSIKRKIAADPSKYIFPDPLLGKTLKTLRQSGKKIFLATNSFFDFTHVVLNYVLEVRVTSTTARPLVARPDSLTRATRFARSPGQDRKG